MNLMIRCAAAIAGSAILCGPAVGQTLGPDFDTDYSVIDLGSPAGVLINYGGLTFLDDDTLLLGGSANGPLGAIYAVDVVRDVNNTITGFGGVTLFADAPYIDGGLAFGPGGVLFYTTYNTNTLGQIEPGSLGPDKIINLADAGVAASVGTLQFVPPGFAGAGQLKIGNYVTEDWHSATLSPDGSGTYNLATLSPPLNLGDNVGPEGIVYISGINPGFGTDHVLISEYNANRVSAYEIDGNGDPILATRRDFVLDLSGAEGAAIDPVTGDFLFSTFGGGNRVVLVTGFVPEPSALVLCGWALTVMFGVVRCRLKH